MELINFNKPHDLNEAREILLQLGDSGLPIAGGTAFQYYQNGAQKTAVDITGLGLSGITQKEKTYHIGSATTISEMAQHHAKDWVLDRVAIRFATQQLRNMSTIGGNLATTFPWADFPVALLALDAELELFDGKSSQIPITTFLEKHPRHYLKPGVLITAVHLPQLSSNTGFVYDKEVRTQAVLSSLNLAVRISVDNGALRDVRIAAGSALPLPIRLVELEKALEGKKAEDVSFGALVPEAIQPYKFRGKDGMSDEFMRHLAGVKIADLLNRALKEAKGEAV